jgi:PAS domain-containing protein
MAMVGTGNERPNGEGQVGPVEGPPESIWARSLGRFLALPFWVVDRGGNLAYFNQAAEPLLGRSFAEVGRLPPKLWNTLWTRTNVEGTPIPLQQLPIMVALRERRPVHGCFHIVGLDGVRRWIETVAIPLQEPDGDAFGVLGVLWQAREEDEPEALS